MELKRISVDTSKSTFTLHGIDVQDRAVLRRDFTRRAFEAFMAKQAPTEVALEACGGSHHWGRLLTGFGHRVRLIPPQYAKAFVKRGKNDRADAAAISEAAGRPDMTVVPVRSAEHQAETMRLSVRDLLIGQRTQLVNTIRGHGAEFGVIAPKGISNVAGLLAKIAEDTNVPATARQLLSFLGEQLEHLEQRIAVLDQQLVEQHKASPTSQRLAEIPGIGPLSALTLVQTVDFTRFKSGRHFAAWVGLTPSQHSTAGRTRLGKISKAGNERLRQLLVVGAMAVIRHAKPGKRSASAWLLKLLEHKPRKLVAVALANKMARIVWAMMTSGEAYRGNPVHG